MRDVARKIKEDQTDQQQWALYANWLESEDAPVRANATICLINQVNFLLDQQIAALEKQFMTEGGYSEQLAAARLAQRTQKKKEDPTDPTDPTDQIPDCPVCGKAMVLRTAKRGTSAGQSFWGCSNYPDCKGVVKV